MVRATNQDSIPVDLSAFAQPIFVERLPEHPYEISATVRFHPRSIKTQAQLVEVSNPNRRALIKENPGWYAGIGRDESQSRAEFHRALRPADMRPVVQHLVLDAPEDGIILVDSIRIHSLPESLAKNGWAAIKFKRVRKAGNQVVVTVESRFQESGSLYLTGDFLPNKGESLRVTSLVDPGTPVRTFQLTEQLPVGSFLFTQTFLSRIDLTVTTFDGHTESWSGELPDTGQINIVQNRVVLNQANGSLELKLSPPDSDGFTHQ